MKKTLLLLLSCFVLSCAPASDPQSSGSEGTLQVPLDTQPDDTLESGGPGHGSGGSGCASCMDDLKVVGTWKVTNHGKGTTGKVTFKADGTYTIDSGTYNAGGSWLGSTSGTYKVLPGGAIAFMYQGSTSTNRIAAVRCATRDRIIHYILAHSHDYEELVRTR